MSKSSLIPLLCCTVLASFLPSCSFVEQGSVNQPSVIKNAKSAYVVKHDNSSRDIDSYLETALANKGLRTSSGPIAAKPKQADIYIEYVDRWTWDMAMYLRSLDVVVRNNRDGQVVASGNFHQGALHTFPNPKEKCAEVIDSIFTSAH